MPLLSKDHFTRLVEALLIPLGDPAELQVFVELGLGRRLHKVTKEARIEVMVLNLVKKADQESWLPELLDKAAVKYPHVEEVRALRAELLVPTGALPGNPWSVCMIRGDQAFIDRRDLRDAVCQLEKGSGRRILIVKGDERTGKSYTRQYVTHRVEELRERLVWINLAELNALRPGDRVWPEDVARSLCNMLRIEPGFVLPKDDEQYARWNLDFCQRLSARLSSRPKRWWIIVDEFNSVLLPQPTLGLFNQLASHTESMMTTVRLVLLGYGDQLPPIGVDESAYTDRSARITDAQLGEFFTQIYTTRGKPFDDSDVVASTAHVRAQVQIADTFPNKVLGREAAKEARRVLAS